jgi:hypothetical protein
MTAKYPLEVPESEVNAYLLTVGGLGAPMHTESRRAATRRVLHYISIKEILRITAV